MTQRICLVLVLCTLGFVAFGCGSVYTRAGKDFGPDLRTRLATRIREARVAAAAAEEALSLPVETPGRADQIEECSWDFSKRVASVHDLSERIDLRDDPLAQVVAAFDLADQQLSDAVADLTKPADEPKLCVAISHAMTRADSYLGVGPNLRVQRLSEPRP